MVVFAKSKPKEDLLAHTLLLLHNMGVLKKNYGAEISEKIPEKYNGIFWETLELAAKFHDLGKLNTPFQNKIKKQIGEPLKETKMREIPHNLLSPSFLKIDELERKFGEDITECIYQAIAFHHQRGKDRLNEKEYIRDIKMTIKEDLQKNIHELDYLKNSIKIPKELNSAYYLKINKDINSKDKEKYKYYIMLKGLLHRLDHSSSAHVEVENEKIRNNFEKVKNYLVSKGIDTQNIWQLKKQDSGKNKILIASTGIGKTEYALFWLDREKSFYTLPVRTSVNAMYQRLTNIYDKNKVGLLHSENSTYFTEQSQKEDRGIDFYTIDLSKQLSMPITISTADQLFTSVFKYGGFEKIYSTMAYSKVILDEIQAYDPEIIAIILKGIEEFINMGSRFCIITATLPPIYKNQLEKILKIESNYKLSTIKKHKIEMHNSDIIDEISRIKKAYEIYGGALIIVNTVKKAQMLYDELCKKDIIVNMLHSGFTYADRINKEKLLMEDNPKKGIWISTQLAEVSLDIDFPILFTEISTIDSLIQRMGRILRKTKQSRTTKSPNIQVFCGNASGIPCIYDQTIIENTIKALERTNGELIGERDKQNLIREIFDEKKISETEYFKKFEESYEILSTGHSVSTKREAQNIFRKINNISIIPIKKYKENEQSILDALNCLNMRRDSINLTNRETKTKAIYTIKQFTVSLPRYKLENSILQEKNGLLLADIEYDENKGAIPPKKIETIF